MRIAEVREGEAQERNQEVMIISMLETLQKKIELMKVQLMVAESLDSRAHRAV